jgi:hypothetical protein
MENKILQITFKLEGTRDKSAVENLPCPMHNASRMSPDCYGKSGSSMKGMAKLAEFTSSRMRLQRRVTSMGRTWQR